MPPSLLQRAALRTLRTCGSPFPQPALHSSAWAAPIFAPATTRAYFVRFQPTPNDDCYKFFVDGVNFIPKEGQTVMFDRENDYQSPIAQQILHALPMVEEVTIGRNFVTVKRVEDASAEAAARYFAMRFQGTTVGGPGGLSDEEQAAAAAERSQALQQRADAARAEVEQEEGTSRAAAAAAVHSPQASTLPPDQQPFFQPDGPDAFEMGGFAVKQSKEEDEALDEAAIRQLIEAMSWSELKMHVCALLTDHMFSGEPHVAPDAPHPHADTLPQEGDSEVVLMIKELLATTVRPQLQDDGGDIRFVRFDAETGAMEVELLGACRTCKSSKTTLVDLIERTTRHWIPEVSAVVEVGRRASAFEKFAATSRQAATAADSTAPPASAATATTADATVADGSTDLPGSSTDSGEAEVEERDRGHQAGAETSAGMTAPKEEEEIETDPTKIAGEGGVHKRVAVEAMTAGRLVRGVHRPPVEEAYVDKSADGSCSQPATSAPSPPPSSAASAAVTSNP